MALLNHTTRLTVQSLQFISPPSAHIYSLSPGLLPDLSLLTGYDLPSAPAATAPKWKDAPATGYGGIHHPKGDRKPVATNSSDPKAKKSIAPAVQAKKPIASTSTSTQSSLGATKATTTKAKGGKTEPSKPPAKVFRPIGSLGGLFAKSIPEPKPKKHESPAPESPVPAKKGKTTKQKPKVESDEDEEWNEAELEEMRVMEVEAKKKASEKNREALAAKKKAMEEKKKKAAMNMAASTSTVTSAKPSASASASASASTSGKESAAEKQKKILEEMMNVEEPNVKMELDDEGDVVVAREYSSFPDSSTLPDHYSSIIAKKRMLKPSK